MAKTGRPLTFTPEIAEAICKHRRTGLPLETSCELEGVLASTVCNWKARAEACLLRHNADHEEALKDKADGWAVAFLKDIARASAEGERLLLERVSAAGKGGWAAGWILERVHRRRYSTRVESEVDARVKVEGSGDADADEAARVRCETFLKASGAASEG